MKELQLAEELMRLALKLAPASYLKDFLDKEAVIAANLAADLIEKEKFGK